MSKEDRIKLIKELQDIRKSKVICYLTSDRQSFQSFQFGINEDMIRPFYEHLLYCSKSKDSKIDLLIYSLGGHGGVPWKLVQMIREFCSEFNVIVPFRAYSAATLIALGADNIIMGQKGELGPIDARVANDFNPLDPSDSSKNKKFPIGVEDMNFYLYLSKDKAKLKKPKLRLEVFKELTKRINPLALGNVYRFNYHSRLVAQKMLDSHNIPLSKREKKNVIKKFIEESYFHGHAIGRKEAINDLKLKTVKYATNSEEEIIWNLFLKYESEMKLNNIFHPETILRENKKEEDIIENIIGAIIESENITHIFRTDVFIRLVRAIPQNFIINIENIQFPGLDPKAIPPDIVEVIKKIIVKATRDEIDKFKKNQPIIGTESRLINLKWEKI